jgi:ribosomal protein S18 acetylase RimI-like enzyme/acyl dehydratase
MPAHSSRPATPDDADTLFAINRQAMRDYVTQTWGEWDDDWQAARFREQVPAHRQVIEVDGEPAGFFDLERRDGYFYVAEIVIAPPHQGARIGTALLESVRQRAAAAGLPVRLQVLKVNPARLLYERLGYEVTAETETHYLMTNAHPGLKMGERRITAFLDGEDSPTISNPIHSTAVAAEYGFKAALVGGVTVYGWMAPAIMEVFGERWLEDGWADVAFRQPVYPGDDMRAVVQEREDGTAEVATLNQDGTSCIRGEVGPGRAPWLGELIATARRVAEPRPETLPELTLEGGPIDSDLRPMAVPFSVEDAEGYARNLQRDEAGPWYGPHARVHPGWIAARMTPLLKHSYHYAPAIHTRTQVQHLAPAFAGQTFTVAGHFVRAFEQKGHHYGVVDGVFLAEDGRELARLRHTTIFRVAKR